MLTSNTHIKPKALSEKGRADSEDDRARLAKAIQGHVGVGRTISTSRAAQTFGVSSSYWKLARGDGSGLPMNPEQRMLRMMGVLPLSFGNELLHPYGRQIVDIPGHKPVNWMQIAQTCAMFAARLNNDASDGVFCRSTELPAQLLEGQALVQTAHAYTASVKAALADGTSIPVACWN